MSSVLSASLKGIEADIAEKAAKSETIAIGQTWQNVKASRAKDVVYTNTSDKPIVVMIGFSTGSYSFSLQVNGTAFLSSSSGSARFTASVIVPAGETYMLSGLDVSIASWSELK